MATVAAIVGVAFAAFCVCLAVRIVNRREPWAKWTLAGVVGLPVLYVASFGPVCWMRLPEKHLAGRVCRMPRIYWPIGYAAHFGPAPVHAVVDRYATLFGNFTRIFIPADPNARTWYWPKNR